MNKKMLLVLLVLAIVTVACAPLDWALGIFGLKTVPIEQEPTAVPTVRIPGDGSQLDHSGGLPYARINVHDDEPENERGFFDRTVINSDDPEDIGMSEDFSVPEKWKVERDFSMQNDKFVDYMTVKPETDVSIAEIREWATEQGLVEGTSYEVTSVVVDEDGQECSMPGLDENRVRVNIYVGENWSCTFCPIK